MIWVAIFIFGAYFSYQLADRTIFPQRQTVEVKSWRKVNGVNTPYDKNGRAISKLYEANQWDKPVKILLCLIVLIAYWKVLGLVIPSSGMRLLVFIVSIPIGYIVLVYTAFATSFG